MTTTALLDRLTGLREIGPGRWMAQCPAHEDRSPSLSIRAADDGKTLFHCFGGCSGDDILAALGLGWKDIYPKAEQAAYEAALDQGHKRRRRMLSEITLAEWAKWVLRIAAEDLRQGRAHTLEDRAVLGLAAEIAKGGQAHG